MTVTSEGEPTETKAPKAQTREVLGAEGPEQEQDTVAEAKGGKDQEATASSDADKEHEKEGAAAAGAPAPPPPTRRAPLSFCCWFPGAATPEDKGEWIDYGGRAGARRRGRGQRGGCL